MFLRSNCIIFAPIYKFIEMINRLLIRTKVIQLVYAFLKKRGLDDVLCDEEELMYSMESAYKLYNYMLALIVKVTDFRKAQLESAQNKYMPTAEERNPNMRFVNNRVAAYIRERSGVLNYCEERNLISDFDTELYRALMDEILTNPVYMAYMEEQVPSSFAADKELWKELFNTTIHANTKLEEVLEEKDIYWNDDLWIVNSFVVKTLQKLHEEDEKMETLPMFKSDDDRLFARRLYTAAIDHADQYLKMIGDTANNWEVNRIAFMDRVIMVCTIAEIIAFPEIPVNITLNEYIELSKYYSTPTSAKFINGILDRIVKNLRQEGVIFKP